MVHFAAPKALVDTGADEKVTMRFVYDDEEHSELTYLKTKFPVNNTNLNLDNLSASVFPSWYVAPSFDADGDMMSNPAPIVNPNKVVIDPSFKSYKGITSTSMWFMDVYALQTVMSILNKDDNNSLSNFHNGKYVSEYHGFSGVLGGKVPSLDAVNKKLESVEGLQNINVEKLASADLMFANGQAVQSFMGGGNGNKAVVDPLTSVDLSGWVSTKEMNDTSAIGMFTGCNSLNNVVFPQTSDLSPYAFGDNTKNMAAIFIGCSAIKNLNFNKNFGSKATSLMYAFTFCSSLLELDLDTTDTKGNSLGQSATNICYFAGGCTSLRILNMRNISSTNVTKNEDAKYAFTFDTELVKFVLSEN